MAIIWLLCSLLGLVLYGSVVSQHVPGYPDSGQMKFYVVVPVAMTLGSGLLVLLSKRLPTALIVLASGVQILVLLGWFFYGGGGV
ncbi:hypothetical protein [Dyella sp. C11]|uniref:hypothetical protein n=1 Tax=Dyella sp. C11 TaxID=2126991 RepID=UPI000D647D62|nr:hypothetical protein [Dyella sp. C11]